MNYRSLSEDLDFLSLHLQNSEWSANSLLNLSKPTEENLLKYSKTSSRMTHGKLLVQSLTFLPRIATRISVNLLTSVLTPWEWWRYSMKKSPKFDWLIVSNTSNLRTKSSVDSVMSHFPSIIGSKVAYLYLNAELTSMKAKKKLNNLRSDKNVFVCPKTENPINTLRQSIKSIKAIFEAILLMTKINETSLQQKSLLLDVTVAQFARQTLSNQLIGKEVSRVTQKLDTRNLIYSYEGNAHELSILYNLKSISSSVRIFPYQHAPIIAAQFGLRREMQRFNDNTIVLTSGSITKEYFQMLQRSLKLHIPIIEAGSPKFSLKIPELQVSNTPKIACTLFLPEANLNSFLESVETMIDLANDYSEMMFVIRKHPSLKLPRKITSTLTSKLPTNCSFSSVTLTEDLQRSAICVFRGSAAAIEAAMFGIYPIHTDFRNDFNMNPLDQFSFNGTILKANTYEQLKELIKLISVDNLDKTGELRIKLSNYARKYFSNPLNSDFQGFLKENQSST
jgi:hypothetical protein